MARLYRSVAAQSFAPGFANFNTLSNAGAFPAGAAIVNDNVVYNTLMILGQGTYPARRVQIYDDVTVANNTWGTGPTQQPFVGGRGNTSPSTASRCPQGQFVCGFLFNTSFNLNWWQEQFAVECCSL